MEMRTSSSFSTNRQMPNLYEKLLSRRREGGLLCVWGFLLELGGEREKRGRESFLVLREKRERKNEERKRSGEFPRMNDIRFWLLPPSFLLLLNNNLFFPNTGTGWTVDAPLSLYLCHSSPSIDFTIFSIRATGISSILGSLDFIVTIFMMMKYVSLNYDQVNIFSWSISITVILLISSLPVLNKRNLEN